MRIMIVVLTLLLASPSAVLARDTPSDIQLIGDLGATNSKERTIEISSEIYRVSPSVKVTATGNRVVDVFLLEPGQPVGIAWTGSGARKTVTHIHVFEQLPE